MRIAPSGDEQSRGPPAGSAELVARSPAAMPLIVWAVLRSHAVARTFRQQHAPGPLRLPHWLRSDTPKQGSLAGRPGHSELPGRRYTELHQHDPTPRRQWPLSDPVEISGNDSLFLCQDRVRDSDQNNPISSHVRSKLHFETT
jgi:hypothetical protein